MTEESAVKVCVRVRPLVEREENAGAVTGEPVQLFWRADSKSIHPIDDGNTGKSFSFDRVFTAEERTDQLYRDIAKPLVVSTVGGYNGTIFAYGQTCSGKTFTMMGSEHAPGVIPLAMEDVFQIITSFPNKEFLLRVSYMEIYNETVTDLLVDRWKRKPLEVREGMNKNVYVADLTEEVVTSSAQVLAWIRKGERNRRYGKTKMNQRSSRSHTIFRMILESRERSDPASSEGADGAIIVSNLNLVDLAGSERASQTGAEGERLKEGCNINRSLFTLSQVMKKLTDESQSGYINYRDSKLTRILQNSLGGNAKTVIVCTVTPASLDETLSTLQFACTAKKMKNDPHVTEVSDDGALLKRYRNEIVDLKRRLHEVSSVTQTTATEKEVLSQLLQEKDQLQREQEDRIRNLTKLLVTGSNLVPVHKIPKRRVTWGGKMLRLSQPSASGSAMSDQSLAEPFSHRRKRKQQLVSDLHEDEEFFGSNWGIPEEPSDDMEYSQTSMSVWSFGDSPKEHVSPGRICELSEEVSSLKQQLEAESRQRGEDMKTVEASKGRVAELELQLQTEAQQKAETLEKMQTAEQKVSELELQLQTEAQQKMETLEKMQTAEQKVSELELQLQTEAQQKMEALEKTQTAEQKVSELELQLQTEAQQKAESMERLQLRVAELERQLEQQSSTDAYDHMRREFAEAIQLCDTLTSDKELIAAERDSLKQELSMCIDQMEHLEREKAALSKELKEMRDLEEFNTLEDGFRKEQENELRSQISALEKALESAELQRVELQNKLQTVSEELKKKSEYAEELQNLSGKSLVLEVAELRRSLDDAEGLSRDTKKEWAVLRSQNISLLELNANLSSSQEKMEAELRTLRLQLETEKSRNRKMQSDLQKELNVAFDENTKLTSLLDGKVPKDLIDSLELERRAAGITKELMAARQVEEALKAQLEELQALPDKVDSLMKQVEGLSEELRGVQAERDGLQSTQAQSQLEEQQLREALQSREEELQRIQASLSSHQEKWEAERIQLLASLEDLEEKAAETQVLLESLQNQLQDEKQRNSDLQEEMLRVSQELQVGGAQTTALEVERLLSDVAALTEERDQLKEDMKENVDMMIETQAELRAALENNREQKKKIRLLEAAQAAKVESSQLEELQTKVSSLSQELTSLQLERDRLQGEQTSSSAQEEQLLRSVTALTEERDQLQEILEGVREEKRRLREELEEQMETAVEAQGLLHSVQQQLQEQMQSLHVLQTTREEEQSLLEQQLSETTALLKSVQEELKEQKQAKSDQMKEFEQRESDLKHQLLLLTDELEKAERNNLIYQGEDGDQRTSKEEEEELLHRVTALTEQRDQLQQELREEKQLKGELEGRMEMLQAEMSGLNETLQTIGEQRRQLEEDLHHSMDLASSSEALLKSVQEELKEQKHIYSDLEELLQEKESSFKHQMLELSGRLESAEAERRSLLCESQKLTEEKEELLRSLTSLKEDKQRLEAQVDAEAEKMRDLQQKLIQQEQLEMQRTSEREEDSRQHRELLMEANRNLSALKQQLLTLEQKSREKEEEKQEVLPSRLQESNRLLQESFGKLQELIDSCRERFSVPLDPVLGAQCSLIHPYLDSLPKASVDVYRSVQWQGRQTVLRLQSVQRQLQARAISNKRLLEVLVKKEEAVFEERRLQDLLLCRTQAPDCDLQGLWERRRGQLLDRQQLHQQEMENILERSWAHVESHMLELRAEIAAREKFREQLQAAVAKQPIVLSELDGALQCELKRRSAAATYSAAALQFLEGEKVRFDELKRQDAQTESLLREEKSKTCTLLQALEGAPLKTEVSLLKDNHELHLQLQEAQENIKALRIQMEQLQEAQASAHSRLSSHKEATQLLQTELQDSRALVQEKEGAIQTLRSKLRESEKRASPAAEDLENLKKKLFQMEVKFSSMSEDHKREIQRMSSMLSIKEDSLRRLKEDLRRAQQRGEESFLQGEALHAKLTNPKGLVVQSSILQEKTKLEEEVKQLQLKITALESLVSSQQAEVTKWKNRAIKLKSKAEMDEPPLPSTSSKRPAPMTAEFDNLLCSPKKMLLPSNKILASPLKAAESPCKPLDSPKSSLFSTPKSRFFDAGGASEVLSRNRPKQFFDNSALGTAPDAAVGASGTDPWWPQSPKKEDFCKPQ